MREELGCIYFCLEVGEVLWCGVGYWRSKGWGMEALGKGKGCGVLLLQGGGGIVVQLVGVVGGRRWEGNKLNFPFLLVKVTCCSRLTYERVCWEQM